MAKTKTQPDAATSKLTVVKCVGSVDKLREEFERRV